SVSPPRNDAPGNQSYRSAIKGSTVHQLNNSGHLDYPSGIANYCGAVRHIADDDTAGTNSTPPPNADPLDDRCSDANMGALSYSHITSQGCLGRDMGVIPYPAIMVYRALGV